MNGPFFYYFSIYLFTFSFASAILLFLRVPVSLQRARMPL